MMMGVGIICSNAKSVWLSFTRDVFTLTSKQELSIDAHIVANDQHLLLYDVSANLIWNEWGASHVKEDYICDTIEYKELTYLYT